MLDSLDAQYRRSLKLTTMLSSLSVLALSSMLHTTNDTTDNWDVHTAISIIQTIKKPGIPEKISKLSVIELRIALC